MSKLPLHIQIIIAIIIGVIWAVLSTYLGWADFNKDWVSPFGTIFIRLLKLIAVPIVLLSIVKGITDIRDINKLGKLGLSTFLIYVGTTIVAITIGLSLVNLIQPGALIDDDQRQVYNQDYQNWMIKTGKAVAADFEVSENTNDVQEEVLPESLQIKLDNAEKTQNASPLQPLVDMFPENLFESLSNNGAMLQVIVFAILFGIAILKMDEKFQERIGEPIDLFNQAFMKLIEMIIKISPFFVFALLAGKLSDMAGGSMDNLLGLFAGLAWYSLVVLLGLGTLIFIIYPSLFQFIGRTSAKIPGSKFAFFLKGISPAQLMAFSTSSSVATLPVTMDSVTSNLKIKKETSSFVLPIGATVNMDGTSLYQAVAVVFLAQLHMVDLTFGQQMTIVFTATLASIGSAAVPSAGLVMLIVVLESLGLNPAWIAIIFPVDRILDMCRTVANVTGDAAVCGIVNRLNENESKSLE
jgi:Na+/H+-dicarboxylate symporter